jgi:hypothetical protein
LYKNDKKYYDEFVGKLSVSALLFSYGWLVYLLNLNWPTKCGIVKWLGALGH